MSLIDSTDRRDFQLVLDLEFPESCPLSAVPDDASDISLQIHSDGCELEFLSVSNRTGNQINHISAVKRKRDAVPCECPCSTFSEHDSVPHLQGKRDGTVTVVTYPPSEKSGSELIRALQECASVSAVEDHDHRSSQSSRQRVVDLGDVSTRQRTALGTAVRSGFFESGGETTLEELAAELDIGPSAFSQRLDRAKSAIFEQLFE